MHKSVLTAIWLVTNPNGNYIFQEQLSKGVHDTLMGFKIVTSPFLPELAADTTVAYFGHFGDAMIMREAGPVGRCARRRCKPCRHQRPKRRIRFLVVIQPTHKRRVNRRPRRRITNTSTSRRQRPQFSIRVVINPINGLTPRLQSPSVRPSESDSVTAINGGVTCLLYTSPSPRDS